MIFVTGDVHREADIHKINPDEFVAGRTLTKDDYVIICGDFGCVWYGDKSDDFWLNWLESLPWTTLFIDGNHENFDLLNKFPVKEWHGGLVHEVRPSVLHLMRGQIFTLDNQKFFTFGGAYSLDISYREEGKNWWKEELPTVDEANRGLDLLEKNDWKVDYILTHDIFLTHPLSKHLRDRMQFYNSDQVDIQIYLEEIKNKLSYKAWFHGHYHVDRKYKNVFTLFENVVKLDELDSYECLTI